MEVPRFRTYVEDVPDHVCDLNTRLVVEMAVFGTEHPTSTERFLRGLRLASVVSRRHPYTKGMFRSTSSLAAEVARHMETAPNIIHPYSLLRSNYEIFMFAVYCLFCIYTPLYIWTLSCKLAYSLLYFVMLLIFWCDIAMNFCTGYVNKKQFVVVLDPKMIAKHYILTYLIVDIISSIPYSYLLACDHPVLDRQKFYWIDIIISIKLIRLPTMFAFYKQMASRFGLNMVTRQVLRTIIALMFYLHWVACFCSVVTAVTMEMFDTASNIDTDESAMWTNHFNKNDVEFTWRNAMLRAITLTFACGFRIIFTEFGDMLVNIIFFLIGIVIVVLVAVRVVVIARTVQMRGAQFETLQTHLVEYMRHKQVSDILERRLMEYYRYCFERTYYHEPAIIGFLSGQLQKDVLLQKGRLMMEATDVFADVPPAIMVRLVAGLRTTVVLPGDVIMRFGDPADRMVFVAAGTVAVYDLGGKELCHLRDGQLLGEQALVSEGEVLGVTVIALEATELWELTRAYFQAATRTLGATTTPGPDARGDQFQDVPRNIFDKLRKRREQSVFAAEREAAALRRQLGRGRGRVGRGGGGGDRGGGDRAVGARGGGARARPAVPRGGGARAGDARPAGGARTAGARPAGARAAGPRPAGGARTAGARPAGARPAGGRPPVARAGGARPARAPPAGARPAAARPGGARPAGARPGGARPGGARPAGPRPVGPRPAGPRPAGARPAGARPAGARPAGARPGGARP